MDSSLIKLLNDKVAQYNTPAFIADDPVQFPRRFSTQADIEVAALLTATIAWGNRTMILRSCDRLLFGIMNGQPHRFIMDEAWRALDPAANIHRTFFVRDLIYICRGLHQIYNLYGSLEPLFRQPDLWDGIAELRRTLYLANDEYSRQISNPDKSACKRLHLMLRWLCRTDGIVDIGVWRSISPAKLIIPLDVHVAHISRSYGLLTRRSNDRQAAEQLTARLRILCTEDPIKYDFALFGIGVDE